MIRAIIIAIVAILLLGSLGAMYAFGYFDSFVGESNEEYAFVPPPINDNPPVNGDAIDSIAREIEDRKK